MEQTHRLNLLIPSLHLRIGYTQDVTRLTRRGYEPAQKMTRPQALRFYTLDAAFGAFEEKAKGSIEGGKLADFTVFSAI